MKNTITGIYDHSWPATVKHYERLASAARLAQVHIVINRTTHKLGCIWPGCLYPTGDIDRKAGEFPREQLIADLRTYRAAAKAPRVDKLALRPSKKSRLLVGNRLRIEFIPPPFMRRPYEHIA